ncbi:MAG: hypothetical protein ACLVGL_14235 [Waltera sp.]
MQRRNMNSASTTKECSEEESLSAALLHYIAYAINNSNRSDAFFRKSLQKSMAKSCDIVIVCGDVITPNMKEQIEEAKQYHKEIYRMIEKEEGAWISCYQDEEEADEK